MGHEIADTRLMPGGRALLAYRRPVDHAGLRVRLRVVVYPDAFYTSFFESLLAQGAGRGEAQIRETLTATRRSPLTVFEHEIVRGAGGRSSSRRSSAGSRNSIPETWLPTLKQSRNFCGDPG